MTTSQKPNTKTAAPKATGPKAAPQPRKNRAERQAQTVVKAAPKATKATATKAAKAAPKPKAAETKGVLAPASAQAIKSLQVMALEAQDAFEDAIASELKAGTSPTQLAKATGLAGSSIRRIGWRKGVEAKPAYA